MARIRMPEPAEAPRPSIVTSIHQRLRQAERDLAQVQALIPTLEQQLINAREQAMKHRQALIEMTMECNQYGIPLPDNTPIWTYHPDQEAAVAAEGAVPAEPQALPNRLLRGDTIYEINQPFTADNSTQVIGGNPLGGIRAQFIPDPIVNPLAVFDEEEPPEEYEEEYEPDDDPDEEPF